MMFYVFVIKLSLIVDNRDDDNDDDDNDDDGR